jgi:gluconokinase
LYFQHINCSIHSLIHYFVYLSCYSQLFTPNERYSDLWPELTKVPFYFGLGDGAAANIGSKCTNVSRIAVTIGTSAAARIGINHSPVRLNTKSLAQEVALDESDSLEPIADLCDKNSSINTLLDNLSSGLWCYRIDRSRLLIGGALTDGGSVFE